MNEDEPVTTFVVASDKWAPCARNTSTARSTLSPDPMRERVNPPRATFDPPSHAICESHVSLKVPLPPR